jgi:metal transporter CNNM
MRRNIARSGSITENIIDAGGIRKVVLETHSSSGEDKDGRSFNGTFESEHNSPKTSPEGDGDDRQLGGEPSATPKGEEVKKKRKRQRKKKGSKDEGESSVVGGSSQGKQ